MVCHGVWWDDVFSEISWTILQSQLYWYTCISDGLLQQFVVSLLYFKILFLWLSSSFFLLDSPVLRWWWYSRLDTNLGVCVKHPENVVKICESDETTPTPPRISVKKWTSNIQGKRWCLIDIPYECVQIMCEERKFDTYQMIMLMILVLSFKVQIPHSTDHNCSNIHWDVMWNLQMGEVTSSLLLLLLLHYWFQGRTTNPVDWSGGAQLQHK